MGLHNISLGGDILSFCNANTAFVLCGTVSILSPEPNTVLKRQVQEVEIALYNAELLPVSAHLTISSMGHILHNTSVVDFLQSFGPQATIELDITKQSDNSPHVDLALLLQDYPSGRKLHEARAFFSLSK